MAGGTGVRFWPVSRAAKPKQFLDVADTGKTFIQSTYERFLRVVPKENILVVTTERYRDIMKEQLPDLAPENLLLEPYARSTAPCIAYATYTLLKRDPEAKMVVTPSDHLIEDEDLFVQTINRVFDYIETNDVLMTLGVVPTSPDTNYGYVQACGGKAAMTSREPMPVKTFTEKPDKDMASLFISTGEFFWNAGIFLWKAKTICSELRRHLPEVDGLFEGWERALGSKIEGEFILRAFTDCPNISIDYGVMEKTDSLQIEHVPTHPDHFYDVHRYTLSSGTSIKIDNNDKCHVWMIVEGSHVELETAGGMKETYNYIETFIVPAATEHYTLTNTSDNDVMLVKAFVKDNYTL